MSGMTFAGSGSSSSGITTVAGNSGSGSPVSGVFNIVGSSGVNTSVSGNTLTISDSSSSLSVYDKTSSFTASTNSFYFCAAALTVTLPSDATQGSQVVIYIDTTEAVSIVCSGSDQIRIGTQIGSQADTDIVSVGDSLTLFYRQANQTWHSTGTEGIWNVT